MSVMYVGPVRRDQILMYDASGILHRMVSLWRCSNPHLTHF